jgi:hypothetical protein
MLEQVDEEVVRECFWPFGENAVRGISAIYAQDAQAADENCHFAPSA